MTDTQVQDEWLDDLARSIIRASFYAEQAIGAKENEDGESTVKDTDVAILRESLLEYQKAIELVANPRFPRIEYTPEVIGDADKESVWFHKMALKSATESTIGLMIAKEIGRTDVSDLLEHGMSNSMDAWALDGLDARQPR